MTPLLEVRDLTVHFATDDGPVEAVDGVGTCCVVIDFFTRRVAMAETARPIVRIKEGVIVFVKPPVNPTAPSMRQQPAAPAPPAKKS